MPSPDAIASIARTCVYGTLAATFLTGSREVGAWSSAALLGGVTADFATWFLRSLALLPGHLVHGCYQFAINTAFGWFLYQHLAHTPPGHVHALGAMLLAVAVVTAAKTLAYAARHLDRQLPDD